MCDLVYEVMVERAEQRAAAWFQAAALSLMLGGKGAMPDLDDVVTAFDEWLVADVAVLSDAEMFEAEWREIVGLGATP